MGSRVPASLRSRWDPAPFDLRTEVGAVPSLRAKSRSSAQREHRRAGAAPSVEVGTVCPAVSGEDRVCVDEEHVVTWGELLQGEVWDESSGQRWASRTWAAGGKWPWEVSGSRPMGLAGGSAWGDIFGRKSPRGLVKAPKQGESYLFATCGGCLGPPHGISGCVGHCSKTLVTGTLAAHRCPAWPWQGLKAREHFREGEERAALDSTTDLL